MERPYRGESPIFREWARRQVEDVMELQTDKVLTLGRAKKLQNQIYALEFRRDRLGPPRNNHERVALIKINHSIASLRERMKQQPLFEDA